MYGLTFTSELPYNLRVGKYTQVQTRTLTAGTIKNNLK